jgi:hypothetical protein
MSTALIIGGVVLGVAVLAGISMMGKKREDSEDTFYGAERPETYPNEEYPSGGRRSRTRSRRRSSRRSKRVKI